MSDVRYPIGRLKMVDNVTEALRQQWTRDLEATPAEVRRAVEGLSESQLDTPYREGGWSLRQLVHHLADSHLHGFVRFKLTLTEEQPTIQTYDEKRWAETPDAKTGPVGPSLDLLEALHRRWTDLVRSLSPVELRRTFRHPQRGVLSLDAGLQLYAWHGPHHAAHITSLRNRKGW